MEIGINNLTDFPVDRGLFKKAAAEVLKKEKRKGSLSIALVGGERIRNLNKKYRGKDERTDVLSFGWHGDFLGEILICPSEIEKNAKGEGVSYEEGVARTLIHGILHLLGYDHEKSKAEYRRMTDKEDEYLALFF